MIVLSHGATSSTPQRVGGMEWNAWENHYCHSSALIKLLYLTPPAGISKHHQRPWAEGASRVLKGGHVNVLKLLHLFAAG